MPFQPQNQARFETAIRRFDAENSRDPNTENVGGTVQPRELVYANWLTERVLKLCPEASEGLRLAARCQHLCRWMIRRETYPMTRAGYLQWREALKKFHAQKAGEILREVGFPAAVIRQVQELNLKKNFPRDPESRILEDALCLVFLEHQFAELAAKTSEDRIVAALQKAWKKMTPAAHTVAHGLHHAPRVQALLARALQSISGQ